MNPDVAAQVLTNGDLRNSTIRRSLPSRKGKPANAPSGPVPATPEPVGLQTAVPKALSFIVPGPPCPKPRQTRSDKWKKRPSVMRYRTWADAARDATRKAVIRVCPDMRTVPGIVTQSFDRIKIRAFMPIPASWNAKTKEKMKGKPHKQKPDTDNLGKACLDAILPTGDEHVWEMQITKRWDDGAGPRTEILLYR